MNTLQSLILSGRVVDLMIALVVIEVLAVTVYKWRSGAGPSLAALIVNLGGGVSLMLALKAALVDAAWQSIVLCLVAALICHVADLALRWRAAATASGAS